nr:MAG TPA: hypothetical protein [Caudoviricetes sp.]
MIVSFYDKNFKGLQNNASLVVDYGSYSLIRRGVDLDELRCTCEPFTEDIQPTFLVVKNDRGNYMYGCLAGIPELTNENKTSINGSDLKSMLKSDVYLALTGEENSVNQLLKYVFDSWNEQVTQGSFTCELIFRENVGTVGFDQLKPTAAKGVYNVWEDIFAKYLRYYNLFMTSELDIVNKKVVFSIGRSLYRNLNLKLWEIGIYNYGKWIADVNECQGCVLDTAAGTVTYGYRWILTSQNAITVNADQRDIYPIKRRVILKEADSASDTETLLNEANQEALETLAESMYQEDLVLENISDIVPNEYQEKYDMFETKFSLYIHRGDSKAYKELPCGELHYDASGLIKVQAGYRFTGLQFLI